MQKSQSDYYLKSLKQNVKRKRQSGGKLSAVEFYLSRNTAELERRLFAPSLLSVSTDIVKVFLRPAPIIVILGLIVATEASTSAKTLSYEQMGEHMGSEEFIEDFKAPLESLHTEFDSQSSGMATYSISPELKQKQEEAFVFASLRAYNPALSPATPVAEEVVPLEIVELNQAEVEATKIDQAPALQAKHKGLIEFISGVIAVYYPSEIDSGRIAKHIVQVSEEEKMDPLYVAALIAVESSFKSHARSKVGATGLMQLRPSTAKEVRERQFGLSGTPTLTDPKTNIQLGIRYLKQLEKRYRGNKHMALAAYNWGPGNMEKVRKGQRHIPGSVDGYSRRILEKTLRWNRHFQKAVQTAAEMEKNALRG